MELVVEKTVVETEEEGTFSKLGNTISKLFGGEEKPVHEETEETPSKPEQTPEEKSSTKDEKPKNETDSANNQNSTETTKEAKPKIVTIKEPIKASEKILTINVLTEKQFEESYEKLSKLDKVEMDINRRATALNNLESFVIDVQNKLYEENYVAASTEEEVAKIKETCSEVSDWLYDEGSDADADTYEKKLEVLKELTRGIFSRVWEHTERPEALSALNSMLNHSTNFLSNAKNLTKSSNAEKDIFTDLEVESLEKLIKETEEWKEKQIQEQNKLKSFEPVKLTVRSLTDKMAALDREVKYLINKIKLWRPKKVDKPKDAETPEKEEKPKEEETEKVETSGEGANVIEEPPVEEKEDSTSKDEEIEPSKAKTSEDLHTEL